MILLIILAWVAGYGWRYLQELDKWVCERNEQGYNCRGENCKHYRRG